MAHSAWKEIERQKNEEKENEKETKATRNIEHSMYSIDTENKQLINHLIDLVDAD